jgi:hypothetical protein
VRLLVWTQWDKSARALAHFAQVCRIHRTRFGCKGRQPPLKDRPSQSRTGSSSLPPGADQLPWLPSTMSCCLPPPFQKAALGATGSRVQSAAPLCFIGRCVLCNAHRKNVYGLRRKSPHGDNSCRLMRVYEPRPEVATPGCVVKSSRDHPDVPLRLVLPHLTPRPAR